MSDTSQPAAKAEHAESAAKAGSALPLTIGIVVVALAAGVALGTLVLGPRLAKSKTSATTVAAPGARSEGEHGGKGKDGKGKEEKTSVFRVENVIVNPLGSEGTHFLMATVAISLVDSKQEESLKAHEDEMRDRVISVLEKQTLESLSAPGARDTLRGRIATALAPLTGSADPSRVYLPQFVIQ
jgi:flagellar basal body-associated protein FliL